MISFFGFTSVQPLFAILPFAILPFAVLLFDILTNFIFLTLLLLFYVQDLRIIQHEGPAFFHKV